MLWGFSVAFIGKLSDNSRRQMRQDTSDTRQKILSISYTDWKKLGYPKGTLHYMKQNAESDEPFTLNAHVRERLDNWEKLVASV